MIRLCLDVGRTFTGLVLIDAAIRAVTLNKLPTTPKALSQGIIDGASEVYDMANIAPADVSQFFHGGATACPRPNAMPRRTAKY
ncbi:MAG: hydantoinase/oxoprolinase N-terminal domain-containing protein [Alphaproteobacteria bacterium]|nr:hydantoinase/oxoprolinase N-terminal domain-containing protein [Alphaproteobacteria bacterium]HJM60493.1 hydantoinase/oxoprolinase N-terminal domain-containing protein [Alphaproteobacteria bacterium]